MHANKLQALIAALLLALPVLPLYAQQKRYDAVLFDLRGRGEWTAAVPYGRLPVFDAGSLREPLRVLGTNSAGLYLRFCTDSKSIGAEWTVRGNTVMNHMSYTGIKGLDLYALNQGRWQFVNTGRPIDKTTRAIIISNLDGAMREYMLYLPLYDGVESLHIFIDSLATICKPQVDSPRSAQPIVVYGTSITQGACASRPGMAYTAILSRKLNREVLNFGFSGNARLDYPIAELIATVSSPKLFLLDFVPNCTVEQIRERTARFVSIIRRVHPRVPIVLVEGPQFPHSLFDMSIRDYLPAKNEALAQEFSRLRKNDRNIYYVDNKHLVGDDFDASVDGIHFTDLGFVRYSQKLFLLLRRLNK